MVWKQVVLLVAFVLVFSFPVGTAEDGGRANDGPAGHDPECGPSLKSELLPYGTKATPGFTSPGLHSARLVYHIPGALLEPGHTYQLYARNPVTNTVPDFDILFEVSGGTALHNSMGTDSGSVPQNAVRAYVFMPVGPDLFVAPGNPGQTAGAGSFTFEHC